MKKGLIILALALLMSGCVTIKAHAAGKDKKAAVKKEVVKEELPVVPKIKLQAKRVVKLTRGVDVRDTKGKSVGTIEKDWKVKGDRTEIIKVLITLIDDDAIQAQKDARTLQTLQKQYELALKSKDYRKKVLQAEKAIEKAEYERNAARTLIKEANDMLMADERKLLDEKRKLMEVERKLLEEKRELQKQKK